jgi:hypothetical protein
MERDMQTNPLELFDSKGRFVLPNAEQIAALDPATQERFANVHAAATTLEHATDLRKAAEQGVTDAIAERDASETALRFMRPKISAVANAKEWIRSQRAE